MTHNLDLQIKKFKMLQFLIDMATFLVTTSDNHHVYANWSSTIMKHISSLISDISSISPINTVTNQTIPFRPDLCGFIKVYAASGPRFTAGIFLTDFS